MGMTHSKAILIGEEIIFFLVFNTNSFLHLGLEIAFKAAWLSEMILIEFVSMHSETLKTYSEAFWIASILDWNTLH